MKVRIGFLVHRLDATRIVDVRHRRDVRARHVQLVDAEQLLFLGGHDAAATLNHRRHHQHVGAVALDVEILVDVLAQHRRREGTKRLAILHLEIERLLHRGRARVAQDGARAERTRSELHAALHPAHRLLIGQRLGGLVDHLRMVEARELGAGRGQALGNLVVGVLGAEVGASHAIHMAVELARLAHEAVIGGIGRAHRAAGITGRRLHPDVVEDVLAQQLAVGDAVQRHAAGQADVPGAGFLADRAAETKHDLLGDGLDRRREIHVDLRQLFLGCAALDAEHIGELVVRHAEASAIVEVGLVEAEGAVLLEVDDLVEDQVLEPRLAVGREAHDLVFTRVDLEAGVVGKGRIEQSQRMREVQLFQHLEAVALAVAQRRGRPLADAIHGQDGGFLERRGKERRGGMALVMLAEQQALLPVEVRLPALHLVAQQGLLEELLLQPQRHGHAEGIEAARGVGEVGLEQAFELQERLVVEGDVVDVGQLDAGTIEAELHGILRKARIVLLAGEALLLGGAHQMAILDQRRRAVVIEGRDAQHPHGIGPTRLEQGVDEGCDRRALGQHDQAAEDHHHDHDRQQPELLALAHEGPEFDDDGAHGWSFRDQNWLRIDCGGGPGGVRSIQ